jgi:hypothetical protein
MKNTHTKQEKLKEIVYIHFMLKIGRTEQSQHQTTSISRETELNVLSHLP